jgi:hypothetical protein
MADKGEYVERLGEFEVYQDENRKVFYLGHIRYASVADDAYEDYVRGWLESQARYLQGLDLGGGESWVDEPPHIF